MFEESNMSQGPSFFVCEISGYRFSMISPGFGHQFPPRVAKKMGKKEAGSSVEQRVGRAVKLYLSDGVVVSTDGH